MGFVNMSRRIFAIHVAFVNLPAKIRAKDLESFDYFEYLNSISFHPPVMIITTLVFFYIRRKILLAGKKN